MKRNKYLSIIVLLCLLVSCTSPFNASLGSFQNGNRFFSENKGEDALIEYCRALKQLEFPVQKDYKGSLLIASIYYSMHLMDAYKIYPNLAGTIKTGYPSVSLLLDVPDKNNLLRLSFKENISVGANIDAGSIDPILLIHRDMAIADELSSRFEITGSAIAAMETSVAADFIKTVYTLCYQEVIKSFYLDAWARALISSKVRPTKEGTPMSGKYLLDAANTRLKKIYFSLQEATDYSQTIEFKRLNEYYRVLNYKINDISSQFEAISFIGSSPAGVAYELLGETADTNYLILEYNFHMDEARKKMNSAIEMIVLDKLDKAEAHLIGAVKNIICAREFSIGLSENQRRTTVTFLSDIFLNLYRIANSK